MCGESLAVMKKTNLERHYSTKHARLSELQAQLRKDKINALKQSLDAQQAAFTRPDSERGGWVSYFYRPKKVQPPKQVTKMYTALDVKKVLHPCAK